MIIAKRSLIFSILLVEKGKGRRLQQRPFAPAYHNVPFSQPRIPSYHTLPSAYPTPPALRQSPARPVAPRPGIVVFGVGPHSLQIPSHYTNYAAAPQQTKPIVPAPAYASPVPAFASPAPVYASPAPVYAFPASVYASPAPAYASPAPVYPSPAPAYASPAPAYASSAPAYAFPAPAYASPTSVVTRTPPRNQPDYAQPAHNQQNLEQSRYHPQPVQPTYPVQSPQYGNKSPAAQQENYQRPSAQVAAVPVPVLAHKLPVSTPTYVAPAKSTVYGSAYVDHSASYSAADSYTKGEASKAVESVPASYQSPAKQPQDNYGATPTVSYTSKPTAIYIGTKSEQTLGAYAIETPKIKESEPSYSTSSPKALPNPYSAAESKPISDSYDKLIYSEKSKTNKDQDKKPVYPAPQSYKETESLSYGEKNKDVDSLSLPYSEVEAKPVSKPSKQDEYKESKQEDSKVTAYPKAESHETGDYQKEKKEEVSVYPPIPSPTKSETTDEDKSYQSHTQTEKSYANKDKPQTPVYVSQSYKEVDSHSYGEQKKEVDDSSLSYSAVESKPVIESSKQNAYQPATEDKVKVPTSSASQDYKEVESTKDVQHYKKQESAVYQSTSGSESYVKNSDSYEEEKQPEKPVVPTHSYKALESLSKPEDEKKHYEAEHIPSKPVLLPSHETYHNIAQVAQEPSKDHESKYPSVHEASSSPVKEANSYSKPASDESNVYNLPTYTTTSSPSYQYSTVYTTTTKVPVTPIEDKVKLPTSSASQTYKKVESQKDIHDYKKQESTVYEHKPVSDSYTKHSASYVDERQPQKLVVSTPPSYKKDEPLPNSEYEKKHSKAEHVLPKAEADPEYKYPSTLLVTQESSKYHETYPKTYESKRPSISPAIKSSVKEVNTYSKPTSDGESNRYSLPVYSATTSPPSYQYSTESTSTRKVPVIPIQDKVKVPAYFPSKNYKDVEPLKDIQHYTKQESAVYEQKPVGDSYAKHSASYVEESQPQKQVVSTSLSYTKDESLPHSEHKQKHYEGEHSSSKAAAVPTYDKQSSTSAVTQEPSKYHESNTKTYYESKYPSVSPAHKSSVKEVNIYSKPTSDESDHYNLPVYSATTSLPTYQYSTGYTTTTKVPAISYEDKPKAHYTTTPKYQEYSTSAKVVTQNPPAYKSAVATTSTQKEDYDDQYASKKDTNSKAGAPVAVEKSYANPTTAANYNVKTNDRVYVVSERDEIAEAYQKKEPVTSYESYPNPSLGEKLSSVKQVVNQYGPSDRDYNSASSGTASQSSYEGRPASSSASELPVYTRKPIKEADTLTSSVEGAKNSGKYNHDGVEGDYSAIPGKPEIDYPIFSELPNNKFNCSEQRLPGYYADTSARCQVFHICLGDRQWSFLCPNGTIFSQQHFVCVWWYEFDCSKAPALYELNEKLFVIPSTQPDYEGEQRTKSLASETSDEIGKRNDALTNQRETSSSVSY